MNCPACGLALPPHARFCARCGAPQKNPPPSFDAWVIVVLGLGVVLSAGVAILYAAITLFPSIATTTMDPTSLRTGSVILAAASGTLCVLQAAAVVGLVRGAAWGRVAATAACAVWSLTCVGVPVAILVLTSIWRTKPASTPARPLDSRG